MKKYQVVLEIFAFYLVLGLLNWFLFPDLLGFLDVDPHPFWLGILLFGFRYGVKAGLGAGCLSAFLYLLAIWAMGERYRFEEINFYLLPSFFVLFGLLVGVLTSRHRQAIHQFGQEKKSLVAGMENAKKEMEVLTEINRGLEKKIVTRMTTLVTLYEGARRLEAVAEEELYPAILEFTARTLQADEAALYLKEEGGWRLAHQYGAKEYAKQPLHIHIPSHQGLIGMAGAASKIISIRDFVGGSAKDLASLKFLGDALLAGPLKMGEKGEVVGVLGIQQMPFFNFTSATINLFQFLLNWASRSLEKARYIQVLREEEVVDPEYQVYSNRYFLNRAEQELIRSKTYYLPFSLGLVQVPHLEFLPKEQKKNWMHALSVLLKKTCRSMDVVALFPEKEIPFGILWMTATDKQASAISQQIDANFQKLTLDDAKTPLVLKIGRASFTPKTESVEVLLQQAREALKT